MRWLHPDDNDKEENASRSAVVSRIEKWWEAFASHAGQLAATFSGEDDFNIADFMRLHLEAIDQRLGWEFGPAIQGDGDRLVITPEHHAHLRPLCDAIIARAPGQEGWEFYHARPAEDPHIALAAVEAETEATLGRCSVLAETDEMNRVGLKFHLPDSKDLELGALQAAIAAESILGEEAYLRWVGRIEVVEHEQVGSWAPLDALKQNLFAEVASIKAELPGKPLVASPDELKWSLWRLNPPQREEYPRQQDLIMGSSALERMSACAQLGQNFDSQRYSNCGETFCFVKFDGEGRKIAARMDERKLVETGLNEALVTTGLGCVVGTGTGKKYSYLDLALTDVDKAAEIIRTQMQKAQVATRSWLLFHDAHLADEWIGVYAQTPPPPK